MEQLIGASFFIPTLPRGESGLTILRSSAFVLRGSAGLLAHHLFRHAGESIGVMFGEGRQDFAVEQDFLFERGADEARVGIAHRAESGIDLYVPHPAEIVLFVAAVRESVDTCFADRHLRLNLFFTAPETVALGLFQDFSAML